MSAKSVIAVIIPAFDESRTIETVVREARKNAGAVYVVDDHSRDDTRVQARKGGAEVLALPFRAGAWCALQAGLLHAAKKNRYEVFVTLDGDGQHDPSTIPALIDARSRSGANVIVGSCPQRGSLGRRTVWRCFRFLTGLKVRDITSGMRVYDRKAVEAVLSRRCALFDYQDLGVLLTLRRKGLTMVETGVVMRPRSSGHSHIFYSWTAVGVYMIRSCMVILSDWFARSAPAGQCGSDYDAV